MKRTTVDRRRTEILETTCEVVIERGFAGTRVADVAKRLGISTGLVHYHFDSKDQLLAEAFLHAARADLHRLSAEVAAASGPLARLDRVIERGSPSTIEPSWMLWIDGWGEALRSPDMRRISRELDESYFAIIESIIAEGVAAGLFACDDPSAAAWRLGALLDGLAIQVTVHEGVITRQQMVGWVRAAACRELGLAADALPPIAQGRTS